MANETRVRRVAERIRQILAELLMRSVDDPRLEGITLTDVEVDREMAFATVYVTALEGDERKGEILKALSGAAGYFRTELARRIPMRVFPKVRFRWDDSFAQGARIEAVLKQLHDSQGDSGGKPSAG